MSMLVKLIIHGIVHELYEAAKVLAPGKKIFNGNATIESIKTTSVTTVIDVNDPDYEYEVKVTKRKKKK